MPRFIPPVAAIALLVALASPSRAAQPAADDLVAGFASPPASARPSCFWWWLNSLVDKEGITRDLEQLKAKGLGGVTLICSGNDYGVEAMPRGAVYLSPEWLELFRHALREADRLGLEFGVNFCGGGWCMGGEWIPPQSSARWFVQSKLTLSGPQAFAGKLPVPAPRDGYNPPHFGNVTHYMTWPAEKMDYRDSAIVAFREPEGGSADLGDERTKALAAKSNRLDADCFARAADVMNAPLARWKSLPADKPIAPADVVELTSRMKPDGALDWQVPPGRWTIVRTGHVAIGCDVRCALPEVRDALEIDWLNPASVDLHWRKLGELLLNEAGPLAGRTFKYLHSDSFEDGFPNWTDGLLERFREYRGYDPRPYLPVFAGKLVGSAEISDRFLYDYRKTVADCMADGSYGRLGELARQNQLEIQCEAAGPSWSGTMCMDGLKNLGRCDRPMGEFWQDGTFVENGQNKIGKQTATAAHIYGRRTASAEAFTGGEHWQQSPATLKPTADRAFCEGINRFVFHTITSTRPRDGLPGYEYGAGTHFNPNVTWWELGAGPWLAYVNRCQYLLQQGRFVADVLYYNGDWAPNLVAPKHVDPSLGEGYDYDVCNAEVLLTRVSVEDGLIALPDGMRYRMLVLPDSQTMPAEVMTRIRQLVRAGATIVGPRPQRDPGLKDYPVCDETVRQMAADLWGDVDGARTTENQLGRGRVIWGRSLRSILQADGVQPDFEIADYDPAAENLGRAEWVLKPDFEGYGREFVYRLEIEIPAGRRIVSALMTLTGDDEVDVKVNGEVLPRHGPWQKLYRANLAPRLRPGRNQVEVRSAKVAPHSMALLAAGAVKLDSNESIDLSTGIAAWLSEVKGEWKPAGEIGGYGVKTHGILKLGSGRCLIDFIHRSTDSAEIYFLANRNPWPESVNCLFRVAGRQPELWDAVTGEMRDAAAFEQVEGRTAIPLEFAPHGSIFVIFRKPIPATVAGAAPTNFPLPQPAQTLKGPWTVHFDPKWGGPDSVEFSTREDPMKRPEEQNLIYSGRPSYDPEAKLPSDGPQLVTFGSLPDWSKHPDERIRCYSGTATYRRTFDLPAGAGTGEGTGAGAGAGERWFLDLGTVHELARVRLNGKDLGVVWTAPWRVDITAACKPKGNQLEIDVVNLWPNRLIGDGKLPPDRRLTRTNIPHYYRGAPLLPSGLLGPVTLQKATAPSAPPGAEHRP